MSVETLKVVIMMFLIVAILASALYLVLLLINKNFEVKEYEIELLKLDNEILHQKSTNLVESGEGNLQVISSNQVVLDKEEKKTFRELADGLNYDSLKYLMAIREYSKSFDRIEIFDRKYYQVISYGQRKSICQIHIKDGEVLVKINLGNIKVDKSLEPIKTKPIKILVNNDDALEEAKKQINLGFYKQSGAIQVSMKEAM